MNQVKLCSSTVTESFPLLCLIPHLNYIIIPISAITHTKKSANLPFAQQTTQLCDPVGSSAKKAEAVGQKLKGRIRECQYIITVSQH